MTLPSRFEANNPPTGSGVPSGIISTVRATVGESNIASYVIPTTNRPNSDVNNIVKWNICWTSSSNLDAYFQVEFKDRYVYPTFYSLQGSKCSWYAKEWRLYGFNEENDEMTIVSENTSVGSTFCTGSEKCASDDWGTFQIINKVEPFRFFRLTIKTPSSSSNPFNCVKGFEIFGLYSSSKETLSVSKKKKTYCHVSYPCKPRLAAYVLLRLLTTYIST